MDDDDAALRAALAAAAAVGVAEEALGRGRVRLYEIAAEQVQQARRESLGVGRVEWPNEFVCPITFCKFVDPVVASDGQTYERSAIQEILDRDGAAARSPLARPGGVLKMPSRAIHDAAMVATVMPAAMLFVPSVNGVSHSFDEHTEERDIEAGALAFVGAAAGMVLQQCAGPTDGGA